MKKREGAAFGFVLAVLLGAAFAGSVSVKAPIDAIHVSCLDGINNDGDQGGLPPLVVDIDDSQDAECLWMPFDFGQGEYDGAGNAYPASNDVASFVALWSQTERYPTLFDTVMVLGEEDGNGNQVCTQTFQDALIEYRDSYGLPDQKTGVSKHQAFCGVSY